MDGAARIATERQRQINAEGWTPEHDDQHVHEEMARAAACYVWPEYWPPSRTDRPHNWPWATEWWKPTPCDRIRELTKAGALIAAEIDRLERSRSVDGGEKT